MQGSFELLSPAFERDNCLLHKELDSTDTFCGCIAMHPILPFRNNIKLITIAQFRRMWSSGAVQLAQPYEVEISKRKLGVL